MKRHLKSWWRAYLLTAALAAWPWVLGRMQHIPPPDRETLRGLMAVCRAEFLRRSSDLRTTNTIPLRIDRTFQAMDTNPYLIEDMPARLDDLRVRQLLSGANEGVLRFTSVCDPDLALAEDRYSTTTARVMEPVRRGLTVDPFDERLSDGLVDLLGYRNVARLETLLAEKAMRNRDWPQALQRLERAARSGDPVGLTVETGWIIANNARNQAWQGYRSLLAADPPVEVKRAALASLLQLRTGEWRVDAVFQRSMNAILIFRVMTARYPANYPREAMEQFWLFNYLMKAVRSGHSEKDPAGATRAGWRRDFLKSTSVADSDGRYYSGALLRDGRMHWTTVPAMKAWVRRYGTVSTDLLSGFPENDRASSRIDRWTLQLLSASLAADSFPQGVSFIRWVKTRFRLMEVAFAARIYQDEHGGWPTSPEQLTALEPALADVWTTVSDRSDSAPPWLPLKMGEPELKTETTRNAFLNEVIGLPEDRLPAGHQVVKAQDGNLTILDSIWPTASEGGRLMGSFALAEKYRAYPALVAAVQLGVEMREDEMTSNTREVVFNGPPLNASGSYATVRWREIDAIEVRKLAEAADRRELNLPNPPEMRAERGLMRLRVELKTPERVFAIWSAGPDGLDEGGLMEYPRGAEQGRDDLVMFPGDFETGAP